MRTLTVLYDGACEFCIRCRRWLERQPKFVELAFLQAGTPAVHALYPDLRDWDRVDELVVVDDAGGVYRGARAWVMCLYALVEYREWSAVLAGPALLPLAKRAVEIFSRNRRWVSSWLTPSAELGEDFDLEPPPVEDGVTIID